MREVVISMSTSLRSIMIHSFNKLCLLVAISGLLVILALPSAAQSRRRIPSEPADIDQSASGEQRPSGPLEDEMRAKRAIKFAESEHKENLERADELSDLATKLQSSYKSKNTLDREDSKRLDRLEKLAKQLRSKAGGSSSEVTLEKAPTDLDSALKRVVELSDSLSELVKKTPRQVVSTAVIDEANVLLELIDKVRQLSH